VSNCGGILSHFLQEQGFNDDEIEAIIYRVLPQKIRMLTEEVKNMAQPISAIARQKAYSNLLKMTDENRSIVRKLSLRKFGWLAHKTLLRMHAGFALRSYAKWYITKVLLN
jgi:hypothetical protein